MVVRAMCMNFILSYNGLSIDWRIAVSCCQRCFVLSSLGVSDRKKVCPGVERNLSYFISLRKQYRSRLISGWIWEAYLESGGPTSVAAYNLGGLQRGRPTCWATHQAGCERKWLDALFDFNWYTHHGSIINSWKIMQWVATEMSDWCPPCCTAFYVVGGVTNFHESLFCRFCFA
jgi:hypothetical protein